MAPRELLLGSFHAAVAAADPKTIVPQHLPAPPKGKTLVVGAGKAAAAMALAVEQNWPASAPLDGLVITRYQHGLLTNRIAVIEAGHPVPDESGEQAAQEILRRTKSLTQDDRLLLCGRAAAPPCSRCRPKASAWRISRRPRASCSNAARRYRT